MSGWDMPRPIRRSRGVILRSPLIVTRGPAAQKPKESRFFSSLKSATEALDEYEALISQIRAFEISRRGLAQQRPRGTPLAAAPAQPGRPSLTNQVIIDMVRSAVPEDEIVRAIKSSKDNYFDTSPAGLYTLSQTGADSKIIDAMRSHNKASSHKTRDKYGRLAATTVLTVLQLLPFLIR